MAVGRLMRNRNNDSGVGLSQNFTALFPLYVSGSTEKLKPRQAIIFSKDGLTHISSESAFLILDLNIAIPLQKQEKKK